MSYITESQLRSFAQQPILESRYRTNSTLTEPQATISIFLSHSHKDKTEAEGLAKYLGSLGIKVYIDWQDNTMPPVTNGETADRIKAQIRRDDIFLLMATKNACLSRWCPWELGIADDSKSRDKILILPVADPSGTFYGNEYLQVYRRIEIPTTALKLENTTIDKFAVFGPNTTTEGIYIDTYLRARA